MDNYESNFMEAKEEEEFDPGKQEDLKKIQKYTKGSNGTYCNQKDSMILYYKKMFEEILTESHNRLEKHFGRNADLILKE